LELGSQPGFDGHEDIACLSSIDCIFLFSPYSAALKPAQTSLAQSSALFVF
jgi:hypothetical protein